MLQELQRSESQIKSLAEGNEEDNFENEKNAEATQNKE